MAAIFEIGKSHGSSRCASYAMTAAFLIAMANVCIEVDARTVVRKVVDDDGNVYEGELRDGIKHGEGTMEWVDGRTYEGDFREGKVHGSGTMSIPNGEVYTGTFDSEVRHGYGKLVLRNGDVYEGSFVSGEMSGKGSLQEEISGNFYQGMFLEGKRHGEGTQRYKDGRRYVGWFRNDLREGFGELHQSDGSVYRGFFSSDLRHGEGVLDDSNQEKRYFQTWENGELVESKLIDVVENCRLEIEGQVWMFDGDQCIDGLAHGEGKAVNTDGSAYIGYGKFVLGVRTSGAVVSLTNTSREFDDD
ncbi:MAG: hypothetical protein OXG24_00200 [Gammaproteobacteria bacterium]|nr:hypothetical protein [Gammaproteobacteria bacterium]